MQSCVVQAEGTKNELKQCIELVESFHEDEEELKSKDNYIDRLDKKINKKRMFLEERLEVINPYIRACENYGDVSDCSEAKRMHFNYNQAMDNFNDMIYNVEAIENERNDMFLAIEKKYKKIVNKCNSIKFYNKDVKYM